jgi:copper chaperone CopZ
MAVKKALMETRGVKGAEVEMGRAVVTYDESQARPEALSEAVRKAGYKVAKA